MNKTNGNHKIENIILERTLSALCTSVSNIICTPTPHLTACGLTLRPPFNITSHSHNNEKLDDKACWVSLSKWKG